MTQAKPRLSCDYCGLDFSGPGFSPDNNRRYCCYGCYLVSQIIGTKNAGNIASWIAIRLGIGAFLSMNVMMISLVLYVNPPSELGADVVRILRFGMLLLATPAMVILGGSIAASAISNLKHRRISMDALIISGSLAAYIVSTISVVRGNGHVYFDTATMLLLVITLGRLIEATAKSRASDALRSLSSLLPATANIIRDGSELSIPVSALAAGDLMVVRPGERVPSDGVIEDGDCLVEESAFTGESGPRKASTGDHIYGGSINLDGFIRVRTLTVGQNTLIEQIRTMVDAAMRSITPVERIAERAASYFAPLVWLAAAGAGAYWWISRGNVEQAALSAFAVVVVACPCALGISAPLAASIAMGTAARNGVLIKSGDALETLHKIRKIFFDKTGTLTQNSLEVVDIRTSEETDEDEALAYAAEVESGSEHSIARAITSTAEARGVLCGKLSAFRSIPGRGAVGTVTRGNVSRAVTVGSRDLIAENLVIPESFSVASVGATECWVGWDGLARALILMTDKTRTEAASTIEHLGSIGVKAAVLSGDAESPTSMVANELGISDIYAKCSPMQKADIIRQARAMGIGIAMAGDGINDALALAEADIGISVGSGTDLARESSDITILGDDLSRIPWVIELSRRTYKTIKWNLFWALIYNTGAIVLAFFGYLHPLIAAVAMLLSSTLVVGNSMRLMRGKI